MSKFKPYTYTHIHAVDRSKVYFGAVDDGLAEQKLDHALILRRQGKAWANKTVESAICASIVLPEGERLLNVGVDGEVYILDFPGETLEQVDTSERGPSELVTLRTARRIGQHIFAAGMARMVYRRDGNAEWTAIDQGVFQFRDERDRTSGFLAIDGTSESDIHAVGYRGEIWSYDGTTWEAQVSPTNVALTCIGIDDAGMAHIAGLAGLYIIGRRGAWRVVRHDLHEDDFWGLCKFGGRMYCATTEGVFRLVEDTLEPVDMKLAEDVSTAYLDTKDGVMWSAGYKDIVRTEDGKTWTLIEKA